VMFPPGCDMLETRAEPNWITVHRYDRNSGRCILGRNASDDCTTGVITSGLSRTSSAAKVGAASDLPAAPRRSMILTLDPAATRRKRAGLGGGNRASRKHADNPHFCYWLALAMRGIAKANAGNGSVVGRSPP